MNKRIITYSLLAYINNKTSTDASFDQIFIPLVKRGLSKMCAGGKFKGNDIEDIRKPIEDLYGLDMPVSILKVVLEKIQKELNTPEKTVIAFYNEGSFVINEFIFEEFEEEIVRRNDELNQLDNLFKNFASAEEKSVVSGSLFEFIEENKAALGKYIKKKYFSPIKDNSLEARFINFINQVPELYNTLQSVYIGSIISTYLEYQPEKLKRDVELVLDTNFIISLIDLNTSTSTSNCRRLLEIAGKIGYSFTVLDITLREFDGLLKAKIDHFDLVFLSRLLDPEDIYNACERRGLSKTDLERIRTSIATILPNFNINIVPHTTKYENKAKLSDRYEKLKEVRNSNFAALHDATCVEYVSEKRKKSIYEFTKVNCWFINNSSSRGKYQSTGFQPFQIKAEELLNLLWLASPMVKSIISSEEMATIGLSRLISATLDGSLPSSAVIRELDNNIHKYAKDNISDDDLVWISKSIASRTITNIEGLNVLAEKDRAEFVQNLQKVANRQKRHYEDITWMLSRTTQEFKSKNLEINKERGKIEGERKSFKETVNVEQNKRNETIAVNSELVEQNRRLARKLIDTENDLIKIHRDRHIRNKVFNWRLKLFWLILLFLGVGAGIILYSYIINDWDNPKTMEWFLAFKGNVIWLSLFSLLSFILTAILSKLFTDRLNPSVTKVYIESLAIPDNLRNKPYED